jgi:2-dehydro-3-deoxyphosphogluconate aldolase/(4S)-4-hydroxy-2-oxoglutarate aldolase
MTALDAILKEKLVAIVRLRGDHDVVGVLRALQEGGVKVAEVTLDTPGALHAVEAASDWSDMTIGVGTVLQADQIRPSVDAGATFAVTPTLQLDTIASAKEHGLGIASGCFTPTECKAAVDAGSDLVKLFPADAVGTKFVKSVMGPMPFLKIVPTGGISESTAADWLAAGCVAVGAGSSLVSESLVAERDWASLTERARKMVAAVA